MPYRTTPLVNDEYYHIYNRGVACQPTFELARDYERFMLYLSYYRFKEVPFKLSRLLQIPRQERDLNLEKLRKSNNLLIEIIAYCLMPNHFHLLVRQKSDEGISRFMKLITDGYTRYFNTKRDRVGPVFQGAFKAKHISNDEQLLHLSRYIHLNPLASFVVRDKDFLSYPWSSLQDNLKNRKDLVNPDIVLQQFKSPDEYLKFVMDRAEYAKELKRIIHLTFEE